MIRPQDLIAKKIHCKSFTQIDGWTDQKKKKKEGKKNRESEKKGRTERKKEKFTARKMIAAGMTKKKRC